VTLLAVVLVVRKQSASDASFGTHTFIRRSGASLRALRDECKNFIH
jgi:hypothetical protein